MRTRQIAILVALVASVLPISAGLILATAGTWQLGVAILGLGLAELVTALTAAGRWLEPVSIPGGAPILLVIAGAVAVCSFLVFGSWLFVSRGKLALAALDAVFAAVTFVFALTGIRFTIRGQEDRPST